MDQGLSLTDPRFSDAEAAAEYLESIRWPDGVVCAKCGESERERYRLNVKSSTRRLWKCRACRKQFTVTVGTIFESSHIPLNKWLAAFYLLCASKKGMSAHQLHRMLGITYKSAWFMVHRIREAMKEPAFAGRLSGVVEADETFMGPKRRRAFEPPSRGYRKKYPVMLLVERGGRARSFRVANVTADTLKGAIRRNVEREAHVMTDGHVGYKGLDREFAGHGVVNHERGEWRKGDAYTNTAEAYFSILKRGVNGVYHRVSEAHLHRYLSEFDFRWNNRGVSDAERTRTALAGAEGKRLRYSD